MINFLKILLSILLVYMVYTVVETSYRSSLFEEWDFLGSIPWMQATLKDFYANILIIYLWVCYKERALGIKLIWAILFFCLGSIATLAYVLIQLFRLKPGENITKLLTKKY